MRNNWILQADEDNIAAARGDYDDYGYGGTHPVSIGDEIAVDDEECFQSGIVVGIIRNIYGVPVCYKVVSRADANDTVGVFDYISPDKITVCDPCGSASWSVSRIGYEWTEDDTGGRFFNKLTGDVIFW